MSKQVNYNENLVAGAAIRDDKGRRISKLFEASHPKMTVGYAKNLIMPDDPTEQEFNFRQSGGGVIEDGVAVIDKVKGNSVVWNQLVHSSINKWTSKSGLTQSADGIIRQTIPSGQWGDVYPLRGDFKGIIIATVRIVSGSRNAMIFLRGRQVEFSSNSWETKALIAGSFENLTLQANTSAGDELVVEWKDIQVINLTQMFGAGNEPSTYEEFLQRKPKVADEFAYNEGTIVDNKVEAAVTTGRNLWDEEWELGGLDATGQSDANPNRLRSKNYIPCIGGTTYYIYCGGSSSGKICFYDNNKNFISESDAGLNRIKSAPINASYMKFYIYQKDITTYNHDICINLSDPTINGQYFPYEEHTLDLSWVKDIKDAEGVKLFEDGMRSAGAIFDEVGKNKVVKRIGVKVFDGTEAFGRFKYSDSFWYFRLDVSTWGTIVKAKYLCNKYVYKGNSTSLLNEDKTIASYYESALCLIRDDSFENVDSFKQHLADLYAAGTPLVVYYELAEPIEVEYDEKNLTYPVVAGGTEEAIASEPSSAFRADIGYGIDAVKTILDLKARVEALEGK